MSSSSEVKAGRAYIEMYIRENLKGTLNKAAFNLQSFGGMVTHAGEGLRHAGHMITEPMLEAAHAVGEFGATLYDMSQRTGMSAEALSALNFSAQLSGTSLAAVETSAKRMQRT